ncbi:hypothetical protein ALC56_15043 [Trachymyrmex septentrionalis]|uniref:Uncharacterized protein n=1 Tax=Trachymyrmex septentrionalis TaxID=34720 RepID=A0A151JSS5_9HYME|nr:hypothetical protein ALC56_15043 [Trachymyrmex septentrionalis]
MTIKSLMVALRDNNDNNKRRMKERRIRGKTQGKRTNAAFKELEATPLEREEREEEKKGTGSRHGYRVFTELKTLGLIWSDKEERRKKERTAESEKGKRREREREKRRDRDICSSRSNRDSSRCCSRRHTIKVEKAKVSSHDACIAGSTRRPHRWALLGP